MNCWCKTFIDLSENINHHPFLIFPGHYNQSLHTFLTQSPSWLMTETTSTKKSCIAQLKDLGHTTGNVAEKENVSPSWHNIKILEKKHQWGCPHKLNDYSMCIMLWMLSNGSACNVTDLQEKEFLNVSVNTLQWELGRCGFNAQVHWKKPSNALESNSVHDLTHVHSPHPLASHIFCS